MSALADEVRSGVEARERHVRTWGARVAACVDPEALNELLVESVKEEAARVSLLDLSMMPHALADAYTRFVCAAVCEHASRLRPGHPLAGTLNAIGREGLIVLKQPTFLVQLAVEINLQAHARRIRAAMLVDARTP